jgi:fatty-acyl-CoA synthase
MAGGIVLHVPFSITDARDVYRIVSISECKIYFVDPGKRNEYLDIILQLHTYSMEHSNFSTLVSLRKCEHLTSSDDVPGILEMKEEIEVEFPALYPEDEIIIFTTSGSTGKPKMVPKSHFHITSSRMPFSGKIYNDRPFAWVGGFPIRTLFQGIPKVFSDSSYGTKGKDTMKIWEIIKEEQCRAAALFPYYLSDLVAHKENYKDSFKLDMVFTGGQLIENIHTEVVGVFTKSLIVTYASTEVFGVSVLPRITMPGNMKVGDVGTPIPGVEVKIIDGNDNVLTKRENGELCVRKIGGFEKYYDNPALTNEAILPGKWFRSGDIAHINEDNHIIIKGRIKDCICRGTRKIIPKSIEEIIRTMDGMKNVIVIGVPDKRLYEEICVCYVTDQNFKISPSDVKHFCMEHFIGEDAIDGLGEMPKYFIRFHTLPMIANGKIDKRQLRSDAMKLLELDDDM